ncbi:hypothetical protein Y695_01127 [Hydrogenophaga sp. T4]|nr:hypothetical protein Y695_01127 [Hydrogenophaga sp. T4]
MVPTFRLPTISLMCTSPALEVALSRPLSLMLVWTACVPEPMPVPAARLTFTPLMMFRSPFCVMLPPELTLVSPLALLMAPLSTTSPTEATFTVP